MSDIDVADARRWLAECPGQADLVLTDPPHLDNFSGAYEHEVFIRQWVPLAIEALRPGGTLWHSCGATPSELSNYLRVKTPDQILVWPHEPVRVGDGFWPSHHWHLVYRLPGAPKLRWLGETVLAERNGDALIPLAKPWPLWEAILSTIVDTGQMIFDPFCGRGEIPHAARSADRLYRGCDLNEESVAHCRKYLRL